MEDLNGSEMFARWNSPQALEGSTDSDQEALERIRRALKLRDIDLD
jgi:hypothetical protein